MDFRVVIIQPDGDELSEMSGLIRKASGYELVATYRDAETAIGQAELFHPNLFLVDVNDTQMLYTLPSFADLFPLATVIGMMRTWDAELAETVLKCGAAGSILMPFRISELNTAVELFTNRGKHRPARIMAFFGPKGRSGCTTLTSALAMALAERSGESVGIIDADLQFGDVSLFFDAEPKHTLLDATRDIQMLSPIVFHNYCEKIIDNVYFLSSPERPEYAELIDAESLISVVRMAGNLFRYVLVDLPSGFNPISIALCEFADTNILTGMLNSGFETAHIKRALEMFSLWGSYGKKIYPVFSRVTPCTEATQQRLEQQLGHPVLEIIPNEYKLLALANSGLMKKSMPKDSLFTQKVNHLANEIVSGKR